MSNLNKDKQGKYIRYVIDNIVDSSDVINVAYISVPWIDTKWNNGVNDIPHTWIQKDYPRALYYNFVDYVRNIYGIESSYNSDNMSWLFNEVLFKLRVKISDYKRSRLRRGLNESEDKVKKLLDFVINDLVSDTKIDYKYGRIYYPILPSEIPHSFFFAPYYVPPISPTSPFSDYCKERYGLTEDEVKYVWGQYKRYYKRQLSQYIVYG